MPDEDVEAAWEETVLNKAFGDAIDAEGNINFDELRASGKAITLEDVYPEATRTHINGGNMTQTLVQLTISFNTLVEAVTKLKIEDKYYLIDVLDFEIAKAKSDDPSQQEYIEKVRSEVEAGLYDAKHLGD